VEEGEGDGKKNKRTVTGEGESWIGEGDMEENRGDTKSYLEGKGNLSSDMGEEI